MRKGWERNRNCRGRGSLGGRCLCCRDTRCYTVRYHAAEARVWFLRVEGVSRRRSLLSAGCVGLGGGGREPRGCFLGGRVDRRGVRRGLKDAELNCRAGDVEVS